MYIPKHFSHDDLASLHEIIQQFSFAQAIITIDGRLEATHAPVTLNPSDGRFGSLGFHFARANPACAVLDGTVEVLWIFSGPHAYISPDWYEASNLVPTWNYVAVHLYGKPSPLPDEALRTQLEQLVAHNEARLDKPAWKPSALEHDHYARLRRGIVGFEMPIDEIQGKWKLNQNRGSRDRLGVVRALEATGDDHLATLAKLIPLD